MYTKGRWLLKEFALYLFSRARLLLILLDIGLVDGQEIVVADATTPKPLIVKIHFSSDME